MRIISVQDGGAVELNWMWLPLFMAQNSQLMQDLARDLTATFKGEAQTEALLDTMHLWIIDWLCNKITVVGLREYLSAISNVKMEY